MNTQSATSATVRPQPRQTSSNVVEQTATQGVSGRVGLAFMSRKNCGRVVGTPGREAVKHWRDYTMRFAGSSRQASGLASSWAASFAFATCMISGSCTPFFAAVMSARMEIAISDGVLLPM